MTTDKPTVEEIRERHERAGAGLGFSEIDFSDIDFLLAEIERLEAQNERLQAKLTAWERSASATSGRSR